MYYDILLRMSFFHIYKQNCTLEESVSQFCFETWETDWKMKKNQYFIFMRFQIIGFGA